jgi:rhodanese-related sulfurtransferase
MSIERIDPEQARMDVTNGNALLVCAYEPHAKFEANHLGGALSLQDLQAIEDDLPRTREIVFYCA